MVNVKGMSNNSPKSKDDMSDSSPYDEFDFYGFTQSFVYCFIVSILISIGLVVSSYGIDLYNYTVQAQNWIMVGRVVGVVCLLVQALFLAICVRVGYVRKRDLSVEKE